MTQLANRDVEYVSVEIMRPKDKFIFGISYRPLNASGNISEINKAYKDGNVSIVADLKDTWR